MKMLKMIVVMACVVLVAACSSPPNSNYKKITDLQDGKVISASYIQWNSEYAVTAKHNLYPKNPDYVSETYDLAFFKHPADKGFNSNIQWRNPSIEEPVTHVGSNSGDRTLTRHGTSINQEILYEGAAYSVSSAAIIKGMSGGPVYSEDKQSILGMSVAKANNAKINGVIYPDIALFIESSKIEQEWDKFQNTNKK